jgi:large subunit ribosomal protein L20
VPRVKRGTTRHARRKRILKRAEGYFLGKSKLYRYAREAVDRAGQFAYRDRKTRKRDFRRLWIIRIGAAARVNGINYNQFVHGLKQSGIELDRKVLADIALDDPASFTRLAEKAKAAIGQAA